jgi:ribose 5-phosphate isomerase
VWLLRPNHTVVCWTLGMPTSLKMEAHVVHVEIPLLPLPRADGIHLSINGVDEVDPDLSLSRAAAARSSRSRWSSAGPG